MLLKQMAYVHDIINSVNTNCSNCDGPVNKAHNDIEDKFAMANGEDWDYLLFNKIFTNTSTV